MAISALRDLAQAEHWYERAMRLFEERDRLGRGRCLSALGSVAHMRFLDARKAKEPEPHVVRYLNDALRYCLQALELLPHDAVNDLAGAYRQLGTIYEGAGDIDRALPHYRDAISRFEMAGDLYWAALTCTNVAVALAKTGCFADARAYAVAALRNYETYGERTAAEITETKRLIAGIEELMTKRKGT